MAKLIYAALTSLDGYRADEAGREGAHCPARPPNDALKLPQLGTDPSATSGGAVRPKSLYLTLCVLGTVLPYSQLVAFLSQHGLAAGTFLEQLMSTPVSRFFALDVLVSAIVLWVFIVIEGKRCQIRHLWAPVAGTLTVGVSLGLPLFLYLRQERLEQSGR